MTTPAVPPGYMRVLIERPHDTFLESAAEAVLNGESPADPIRRYNADFIRRNASDALVLDDTFGAIPIGSGAVDIDRAIDPRTLTPRDSKLFVTRGFLRVSNRSDVPHQFDGNLIHSDPVIGDLLAPRPPTCGNSRPVGNAKRVKDKLQVDKLAYGGLDGSDVAIAIVDSGIYLPRIEKQLGDMKPNAAPKLDRANSWAPPKLVTKPGRHRLGHGTMCAYDALIAAPNATLVDVPMLLDRARGDHTSGGTVSAAMRAYFHLLRKWVIEPALDPTKRRPSDALVVSNSWGIFHPCLEDFPLGHPQRYIDNPLHIFRLFIKWLELEGVDIVFCGNNCGPTCQAAACLTNTGGTIMGANTYPEVLTVGGCDTNDELVGYSSHGPSIAGMLPHKPDITGYTHFLGSKARRIYRPDTGVSAACPVVAGCVAALRTKLSPSAVPPAALFNALRTTARTGVGGGPGGQWNAQYGFGIIDPVAAGRSLGLSIP
jgi:hypothetical protein